MSFVRNAGSVAVASVLSMPVALITSVLLARYLGPEDMGVYSVLQRFSTVAFVFCLLGSQSAAIYRLRNARIEPVVVATTALLIVLGSSLLASALLLAFGDWIATAALGGVPTLAYFIALITIPAQTAGAMMMGFARGLDRFALSNAYLVGLAVALCVALTVGFTVYGVGLIGALSIVAAVQVAATLALTVRMFSLIGFRLRTSSREIVETARYGIKSQAQMILTHVHENIDVLILAALLDAPDQVAFYAISKSIVDRIKVLPTSISNALLPHVASLEPEQAASFAARASRHSFVWVSAIALLAGVAAPILIPWAYGEAFAGVLPPTFLLLPASIIVSTNGLLARYFMAINRQGVVVKTQACSTTLNVCLNLLLIPTLGIVGAAIASLVSYTAELLMITTAFRKASRIGLRRIFILDRDDVQEYLQRAMALRKRGATPQI